MKDLPDEDLTRATHARFLLEQIQSCAGEDKIAAIAACDAALDILSPAFPECAPAFDRFRDEAEWWAEFATDTMRAEMLRSCLKHVATIQINTRSARKLALAAIWNSMDETDRTAFLEFVDPVTKAEA